VHGLRAAQSRQSRENGAKSRARVGRRARCGACEQHEEHYLQFRARAHAPRSSYRKSYSPIRYFDPMTLRNISMSRRRHGCPCLYTNQACCASPNAVQFGPYESIGRVDTSERLQHALRAARAATERTQDWSSSRLACATRLVDRLPAPVHSRHRRPVARPLGFASPGQALDRRTPRTAVGGRHEHLMRVLPVSCTYVGTRSTRTPEDSHLRH